MIEHAERPWGAYTVLAEAEDFKVKTIEVQPGQRLSYQRHSRRAEHWFVVGGEGVVTLDGESIDVRPGDAVDVPLGMAHRIHNTGHVPLAFVEVQHGDYFGEDDIVRLDDDYGRLPPRSALERSVQGRPGPALTSVHRPGHRSSDSERRHMWQQVSRHSNHGSASSPPTKAHHSAQGTAAATPTLLLDGDASSWVGGEVDPLVRTRSMPD